LTAEELRTFEGHGMDARAHTGGAHANAQSAGSPPARAATSAKTSLSHSSVGLSEKSNSEVCDFSSSEKSSGKINEQLSAGGNNQSRKTDPVAAESEDSHGGVEAGDTSTARRKKSAVSQLIARFESQTSEQVVHRVSPLSHLRFSRSVTPERGLTSSQSGVAPNLLRQRSLTPDQRPSSASATLTPNAASSQESLLKKAVTKSASECHEIEKSVSDVKEEEKEVDLNDNPVGKESESGVEEEKEKIISEKEKHSKDENLNAEEGQNAQDEDGKLLT